MHSSAYTIQLANNKETSTGDKHTSSQNNEREVVITIFIISIADGCVDVELAGWSGNFIRPFDIFLFFVFCLILLGDLHSPAAQTLVLVLARLVLFCSSITSPASHLIFLFPPSKPKQWTDLHRKGSRLFDFVFFCFEKLTLQGDNAIMQRHYDVHHPRDKKTNKKNHTDRKREKTREIEETIWRREFDLLTRSFPFLFWFILYKSLGAWTVFCVFTDEKSWYMWDLPFWSLSFCTCSSRTANERGTATAGAEGGEADTNEEASREPETGADPETDVGAGKADRGEKAGGATGEEADREAAVENE